MLIDFLLSNLNLIWIFPILGSYWFNLDKSSTQPLLLEALEVSLGRYSIVIPNSLKKLIISSQLLLLNLASSFTWRLGILNLAAISVPETSTSFGVSVNHLMTLSNSIVVVICFVSNCCSWGAFGW